ncbi:pyruvate:ferredoxin (flavodoxin) oxidoreductase [bacterium]|nr:pyruvate:ferredoxin (flavodoxin) oxidoreductase [bacterium]
MAKKFVTIDGNYAAAYIAYAFSEVAAIYPITPSSNMGEYADDWASKGKLNMFGQVPRIVEMQSEGGAAGAVHGSLTAGSLTTTFTASQGLLLMIPNMYKISGELLPAVFHVSARTLATHALSIFGDHSDVMGCRMTGWAMTAAASIQETMDMAAVAHLSTLETKVPFLSFFDGFRTSHEVQKVELIEYETLRELVSEEAIRDFRDKALKPEKPYIKVGAQNPDVWFQGREAANAYYTAIPEIVQKNMDRLAEKTGRHYRLFDYYGAPDAEKVIIIMGSGAQAVMDTVDYLTAKGEKVGVVNVHLYRPFSVKHFLEALPKTVKKIAVLDRTKEPGSIGEPLYLDIKVSVDPSIFVIGGRYGLSSKEFTPSMVKAVYDHLENNGFHGFTVGINDDLTGLSLKVTEEINAEPEGTICCKFWGLGSDGTVGANKNSIKIIGDHTDMYAQGYFSYDSKKSGGITISHLRFGKKQIRAPYLVSNANFIACHNPSYIGRYDLLDGILDGGVFLLNSEFSNEEVFNHLTKDLQETIIRKKLKFYNINALQIAKSVGLGGRINTVMQAAFFKISGVIPKIEEAIKYMKDAVQKDFGRKGQHIVDMNWKAIDATFDALVEIPVPTQVTSNITHVEVLKGEKTDWVKDVVEPIVRLKGDLIPVSKLPVDGKMPLSITKMEKRRIAPEVITWYSDNCIQCGQCAISCPHAAIRSKRISPELLETAPETFKTIEVKKTDLRFKIQVYVEDCTGCGVCYEVCPAKTKALGFSPLETEIAAGEIENAAFFDALPENLGGLKDDSIQGSQMKTPLFEFSGACAGCGETPYVKLVTQLFGDRMVVANATGCSSIYGGTFPSSPYTVNAEGHGPAWANSLFEDNAEFGMGMRLAVTQNRVQLKANVEKALACDSLDSTLRNSLNEMMSLFESVTDEAKAAAKAVKAALPVAIAKAEGELKSVLLKVDELKDYFIEKSVWIFGGDGWAYDIGYGGLDHVIASGENVNILVLDTEVYSNTGGQASKSTPIGSVAKFAAAGKERSKKNLGLIAMSYGYVYVAHISMGANKNQVVKAFKEAEAYNGPSIVIAYAPCIAHGFNLRYTPTHQKIATETGYWPIYRYNPNLAKEGKNPLQLDSKTIKGSVRDFILSETRYKSLQNSFPAIADERFEAAEKDIQKRFQHLLNLANMSYEDKKDE